MIHCGSNDFQQSLADTVAWCNRQNLEANPTEPLAIQLRRAQIEKGGRLIQLAYKRAQKSCIESDYWKRNEYRTGLNLIHGAEPDSIAPLQEQLRSPALKPSLDAGRTWNDGDWQQAVAEVVSKRSASIAELGSHNQRATNGRLLLYVPEENLADGAAKYSSKGFFDVDNVPPWDLWIHYSDKTLISYVPQALVPLAQAGVDVNPEQCISWADPVMH